MKKILYFAATLAVLVSCSKNIGTQSEPDRISDRISVSAEQTKTGLSHAEGKFSFTWKSGDAISLMEYVPENMAFVCGNSDPLSSDAKTAAFTVKLGPQSLGKGTEFHYVAAYPVKEKFEIMGWNGTGADAYPILSVEIPTSQELPSNTSFDPKADILVSNVAKAATRPEDLSMSFARIGGILQLHLTGLPVEGSVKYLEEGSISVSGTSYCFGGSFLYFPGDTMIESMSGSGSSAGGGTGSSKQLAFSAAAGVCPVVNGETDVFLRCCTGTLTGNVSLQLVVKVDGEQRVFKKEFSIGGGAGSGSGKGGDTTASGGSTGSGGTTSGVTISNGRITRMNIATEEELTPDYAVVLSGVTPSEDKCAVEAEVIDIKGKGFTGMKAHLFYGTTPAATPEEFMTKSTYVSVGTLPIDGKFLYEIQGLNSATKYYLVVAVDDGKKMYCNEKVEEFQTTSPAPEPYIIFNAEYKDGKMTVFGSVDNYSGSYVFIHWDEGTGKEAKDLTKRTTATLSDGWFGKEVSGTFKEGSTYSLCASVTSSDGKTNCYSMVATVKIESGGGGKDPVVTLYAVECKDGFVTVVGKVENYDCTGQYAYIHWDEGTMTVPSTITTRDGAPLGSDGTFSYGKEVSGTFNEGSTYSLCASVGDGKTMYYSSVSSLVIPASTPTVLTLSVGNFQVKGTGSSGTILGASASGAVNNSTYYGKNVYIYAVAGTYTKAADVVADKNKIAMGKTSTTDGSYSASPAGFIQGKTYTFCAGLDTGTGSYIYSDVFVCTASTDK